MRRILVFAAVAILVGVAAAQQDESILPAGGVWGGLLGQGAVPQLVISASGNYGSHQAGTDTDAVFTVTAVNGNISSIADGLTLAAPFTWSSGSYPGTAFSACGTSLSVGTSCNLSVRYHPTAAVTSTGTVTLSYSNGVATKTATAALSGTGTLATLSISDTEPYDYGTQTVNTNTDHTFTLTSGSGGSVNSLADGATLSGAFSYATGSYPGGGTCSTSLTASSTCTIIVRFRPTSNGSTSSTITMNWNDGAGSQSTTRGVTGTGTGAVSNTTLTITNGTATDTKNGNTSTFDLTVTNTGAVQATGLNISSAPSSPFSIAGGGFGTGGTCTSTLNASATCTIRVTYGPGSGTTNGTDSGSLAINWTNNAGSAQTSTLGGYHFPSVVFWARFNDSAQRGCKSSYTASTGQTLTATRTGTATVASSDNSTVTVCSANQLRISDAGLLVESASSPTGPTNWITYSEDFSQWTATNTTVTTDQVNGPSGTLTADTLQATSNGGYVRSPQWTKSSANKVNFSVWLKTASGTQSASIAIYTGGTTNAGTCNITVTSTWNRYNCTTSANVINGSTTETRIYPGGTGGTGTVYAWGGQGGDYAMLSYVPTSGASVQRGEDLVSISGGLTLSTTPSASSDYYTEKSTEFGTGVSTYVLFLQNNTTNRFYCSVTGVSQFMSCTAQIAGTSVPATTTSGLATTVTWYHIRGWQDGANNNACVGASCAQAAQSNSGAVTTYGTANIGGGITNGEPTGIYVNTCYDSANGGCP